MIKHKYYAADQLKEFVLTCDINEVLKEDLKTKQAKQIDNWVLSNEKMILPQCFAAQRVNDKGKGQPPRMMSWSKYYEGC